MMRVLFVCTGNICRSPMAEAVFRHKVKLRRLEIDVDSAGTGAWHAGEDADARALTTLKRRGIPSPTRARQVTSEDFGEFDLIFAMDRSHFEDLLAWPGADPTRVKLFLEGADTPIDEVPDPYYGGEEGFEYFYELLDRGTDVLLLNLG